MRACKLILKIARRHKSSLFISLGTFLLVFIILSQTRFQQGQASVEEARARIAILNESQDPMASGLSAYLAKGNTEVSVGRSPEDCDQAIFRDKVDYILVFPGDFAWPQTGSALPVQTWIGSNDVAVRKVDQQISQYATTYRILDACLPKAGAGVEASGTGTPGVWSAEERRLALDAMLQNVMDTRLDGRSPARAHENSEQLEGFLAMLGVMIYVLLQSGFTCIGLMMARTEQPRIKNREIISGYDAGKRGRGIALASFSFLLALWGLALLLSLSLVGFDVMGGRQAQLALLSSLVHVFAVHGLIVLIMQIFRSENAAAFFSTAYSLVVAFTTGIFLPRFLLPDAVLAFAHIFPSYWQMDTLAHLTKVSSAQIDMARVGRNLAILLTVGMVTFAASLLVRRRQNRAR